MNEILNKSAVVLDVATERKKYVSPEIEVIDLDAQPMLLAGSPQYSTQWGDYESEDI